MKINSLNLIAEVDSDDPNFGNGFSDRASRCGEFHASVSQWRLSRMGIGFPDLGSRERPIVPEDFVCQ